MTMQFNLSGRRHAEAGANVSAHRRAGQIKGEGTRFAVKADATVKICHRERFLVHAELEVEASVADFNRKTGRRAGGGHAARRAGYESLHVPATRRSPHEVDGCAFKTQVFQESPAAQEAENGKVAIDVVHSGERLGAERRIFENTDVVNG